MAFSLLIIPFSASAERPAGRNTTYGDSYADRSSSRSVDTSVNDYTYVQAEKINPKPVIYSIDPKSGERSGYGKEITIVGKGFIPTSVARVNGEARPTLLIDSTRIILQANGNDMYRSEKGFYVTVWNEGLGGGFSNSKFFDVKEAPAVANTTSFLYPGQNNQNTSSVRTVGEGNSEDFSSLTANAVYGSNSFLPSGAIQWVMFAIVILLMIMMARKYFGAEEAYQTSPLKHD